jgi:XTP/dITP diphosphohydrolase
VTGGGATPRDLVVATTSAHKLGEIRRALDGAPVRIRAASEFPEVGDVPEDAPDYAGNARAKALAYAVATGLPALADDSGLEIDALGGAPGVRSRRFAGEATGFEEKMARILDALADRPDVERAARFRCVVALALPGGAVALEEGVCEGHIARAPRGDGGFGYDPIFVHPPSGRTFAELAPDEKLAISHRGRALAKIRPRLTDLGA